MARFYCENFSQGSRVMLDQDEAHHLVRVLRLTEGEKIVLIDGKGALGEAVIVSATPKKCEVDVLSVRAQLSRSRLVLGFGIPKGPAQDFIFRRVTEIGLRAFQPIGTEHSLKASDFNEERWSRVIPEIAKQCEETVFPEIRAALTLENALSAYSKASIYYCDELDREPPNSPATGNDEVLVLVGPEGGWSKSERKSLESAHAKRMGLGPNRLRAETACLVAASLMKERMGELTLA